MSCRNRRTGRAGRGREVNEPRVTGRSALGYLVKVGEIDLAKPIVITKIDHTAREVHVGASENGKATIIREWIDIEPKEKS